jgi:hypothetical protein
MKADRHGPVFMQRDVRKAYRILIENLERKLDNLETLAKIGG